MLTTSVFAHRESCVATSTSAAAPPAIMKRLCTRQRITHSASCSERSASCHCAHNIIRSDLIEASDMCSYIRLIDIKTYTVSITSRQECDRLLNREDDL